MPRLCHLPQLCRCHVLETNKLQQLLATRMNGRLKRGGRSFPNEDEAPKPVVKFHHVDTKSKHTDTQSFPCSQQTVVPPISTVPKNPTFASLHWLTQMLTSLIASNHCMMTRGASRSRRLVAAEVRRFHGFAEATKSKCYGMLGVVALNPALHRNQSRHDHKRCRSNGNPSSGTPAAAAAGLHVVTTVHPTT